MTFVTVLSRVSRNISFALVSVTITVGVCFWVITFEAVGLDFGLVVSYITRGITRSGKAVPLAQVLSLQPAKDTIIKQRQISKD